MRDLEVDLIISLPCKIVFLNDKIVIENDGKILKTITSYRQYLDVVNNNSSFSKWSQEQHNEVYKWIHKAGWLKPK